MINELVLPKTGEAHSKKNAVMDYLKEGNPLTKKVKRIVLSNPSYMLYYCKNILKGEWAEAEEHTLKTFIPSNELQEFVVNYAVEVKKQRWFEAERIFRANKELILEYQGKLGFDTYSKTDVLPMYIREYVFEEVKIEPIEPDENNKLQFYTTEEVNTENRNFTPEENSFIASFKEYAISMNSKRLESYTDLVVAPFSQQEGRNKIVVTESLFDYYDREKGCFIYYNDEQANFVANLRPKVTFQSNGKLGYYDAYEVGYTTLYGLPENNLNLTCQFFKKISLPEEGDVFVFHNPHTKKDSLVKISEVEDHLLDCVGDVPLKHKDSYYGGLDDKSFRVWSLAPEKNLGRYTEWLGLNNLRK